MKLHVLLTVLFFSVILLPSCGENKTATAIDLRCEFQTTPLGIETLSPRFQWVINTDENNYKSKAYRIRIASSIEKLKNNEIDVYDSGKQSSEDQSATLATDCLQSYTRYYWDVQIWDRWGRSCVISEPTWFETAKLEGKEGWIGEWISDEYDKEYRPAPLFRKSFQLKQKPISARAYVSGLGYCHLYINGTRIGTGDLDPGFTDYSKRILYMTYDLTDQLSEGENVVAAELGNGWFNNQTPTVWKFNLAPWRERPQLLCELHLYYPDNTKEIIFTDKSWKTSTGALQYDNLYVGSIYDAQKEQPGWNTIAFNDSKWKDAKEVEWPAPLIQSQQMPAIGVGRIIKAKEMKQVEDKTYLFDLGENFAGVVQLKVQGSKGTRITIRHGELLNSQGRLDQSNINMHLRPTYSYETIQTDVYIMKGEGEEIYTPPFTYHGFQYVEVSSDKPIQLTTESLSGLAMHSLVDPIGSFHCSNELLNTLYENCNRSYLSNLYGIPTDCPHREKNGWMADGYMVMEAGMLNYDSRNIYAKWVNDMIDAQEENGNVAGIVPTSWRWDSNWAGPLWDAAIFIVPDLLYTYYGDTRAFEAIYPSAKRYLEYLEGTRNEEGLIAHGLGDWLYYKAITPVPFLATCFYYQDCMTMAKMAALLGTGEEKVYKEKAEELKSLINQKFFNRDSASYANGTQLAYALPLYLDIVPKVYKKRVADNLAKIIRENDCSLDFGFIGSVIVPQVLSDFGYNDIMYEMATKTTMPSWGYWIKEMGATSLYETWDIKRNIGDASLNHPSMGGINAWMMKSLAGINIEEGATAFERIVIKPSFEDGLDFVEASHQSIRGKVAVDWKRTDEGINLNVLIPAGSSAKVILPAGTKKIGSGNYTFTIKLPK